jgi:hypothetical protein
MIIFCDKKKPQLKRVEKKGTEDNKLNLKITSGRNFFSLPDLKSIEDDSNQTKDGNNSYSGMYIYYYKTDSKTYDILLFVSETRIILEYQNNFIEINFETLFNDLKIQVNKTTVEVSKSESKLDALCERLVNLPDQTSYN